MKIRGIYNIERKSIQKAAEGMDKLFKDIILPDLENHYGKTSYKIDKIMETPNKDIEEGYIMYDIHIVVSFEEGVISSDVNGLDYLGELMQCNDISLIGSPLTYDDNQLRKIGSNVASLWGAECYGFEIDTNNKVVIFHCIEHGERFATDVGFEDLGEYLN